MRLALGPRQVVVVGAPTCQLKSKQTIPSVAVWLEICCSLARWPVSGEQGNNHNDLDDVTISLDNSIICSRHSPARRHTLTANTRHSTQPVSRRLEAHNFNASQDPWVLLPMATWPRKKTWPHFEIETPRGSDNAPSCVLLQLNQLVVQF